MTVSKLPLLLKITMKLKQLYMNGSLRIKSMPLSISLDKILQGLVLLQKIQLICVLQDHTIGEPGESPKTVSK